MKTYKCDICEKIFKQKSHFDNHKKRKIPCIKTVSSIVSQSISKKEQENTNNVKSVSLEISLTPQKPIACKYCSKQFTFRNNLYRHMQTCKIKTQINQDKESIYNKLVAEMEELKKSNAEIKTINKRLMRKINKLERNAQISINNKINTNVNNGHTII